MKNHKLIVALFIGVISAEQIPNINMIGAGMAHNDFLQVTKDTQAAKHAFKSSVEKGYLFDVSEGLKQDYHEPELNVFRQNSPMMNMQAQKT